MNSLTVNLMVEDVDAAVDWYRKNLNFEAVMQVPEERPFIWAMMGNNGAMIMFQSRASLSGELANFADMPIGGALTLYLKIGNPDEIYERIKDEVDIVKAPYTAPYGAREFVLRDLNGLYLTLAD